MIIHLDEDDAPNPADREQAVRIIKTILANHVTSRGVFMVEGYSAARLIAQALTAAREDERRRGFATPFKMRKIKPAPGAPAVLAKWPALRPLRRWLEVDGMRFQNYGGAWNGTPLISDDGRIVIEERPDFWTAHIDGHPVPTRRATLHFKSEIEAARTALHRLATDLTLQDFK